ncbi:MAG: S41 family peptidase [Pseudomonadota bacterium]
MNEKSKNKEQYGYVRIYTFNIKNPVAFINEFIRLVSLLPRNGLIIDVRGNGGGHIWAAEGLLQTLTPYAITPEPTQFINTSLNADICGKHNKNPAGIDLSHWHESIRDAIATGAIYSRPYPITTSDFANRWGQHYHGPVVLITDARCYSATDLFAAGFQDHMIGTIIGIDKNTGAGGANVWTHSLLKKLSDMVEGEFSPYETLPKKAGMRVSIRRTLRVGDRAGTPVEDIGVTPDIEHKMTKNDLLNGNEDLINCAIRALKALPVRQLDVDTEIGKSTVSIKAVTRGLDRLDTYIDDRPMSSVLIKKGATASYEVELPKNSTVLSIAGHDKGDWVATRSIQLKWPD